MTNEDDFQRKIDEEPEDWQTRLVFADWLQDRGDPRSPRVTGQLPPFTRRPLQGPKSHKDPKDKSGKSRSVDTWWWHCPASDANLSRMHNYVPRDWFDLLPAGEGNKSFWPLHSDTKGLMSRRDCEDALALAFSKLPAARQAELLVPPAEAPTPNEGEKPKTRKKK